MAAPATRRILVTGGNRGIGLAIVQAVLSQSADNVAIIGTRSVEAGLKAVGDIVAENPSMAGRVETVALDVTSRDSISSAAAKVGPIYALVNNAGCLAKAPKEVFDTNLVGVKNVCDAFIPLVQERIVMISSGAASSFLQKCSETRVKQLTADEVTWGDIESIVGEFLSAGPGETEAAGFGPYDEEWAPYGLSKAALNSLTIALARENPHLAINACSPGMIRTDLFKDFAAKKGVSIDESIAGWGAKPPSESTVAPLALLFGVPGKTGLYFGSDGLRSPFARYRSPGSAEHDGVDGR